MATSSKSKLQKLSVALNIIAAACSMMIGIPWLIRHNRYEHHFPETSSDGNSTDRLRKVITKLQNSGYSSLTADERALIADSIKKDK